MFYDRGGNRTDAEPGAADSDEMALSVTVAV